MNKKILWAVVSGLMVLSLVLAACGPATTTTPPATTSPPPPPAVTTPAPATAAPSAPAPPVAEQPQKGVISEEIPRYGGTLTVAVATSPSPKAFWPAIYQQFMGSDWTKSAAGTGEVNFAAGARNLEDQSYALLAESWEMPDPTVWILNVRRGVHWAQTPYPASGVMNGRELTADDVVNSFNWQLKESPRSWIFLAEPAVGKAATIEKTGPWQVTIKTPVNPLTGWGWIIQGAGYHRVYPYDVVKRYNHQLIYQGEGWPYQEAVGTGPFTIDEVVAGTLIRYKKNPNYWDKDPVGPGKGNKLPYIDTYVELTIPDRSTQMAAFRTGKIDLLSNFTRDDWNREQKLTPNLESVKVLPHWTTSRFISMRIDKKDKPYSDVKVRKALMMATDFISIKNDYYTGDAEIDIFPLNKEYARAGYTPLDQMPQSVRDLYTYNPEKAKQLLKEAGYPNGFKTTVVTSSAGSDVDELSIFKAMWAKVGVELVIDARDQSTFNTIWGQRAHEDMSYRYLATNWPWPFTLIGLRGPNTFNQSYVDDPPGSDPNVEKLFNLLNDNILKNMPEVYRLMAEDVRTYYNEQAFYIPRPTPYAYNAWWPWLKNYYGFSSLAYHWIDQDLKKQMGH